MKIPACLNLLGGTVELKAPEGATLQKTFSMLLYSGQPVDLYGIPAVFDLKGMGGKPELPTLQQHDHTKIAGLGKWSTDGRQLMMSGRLYKTRAAQDVEELAADGFPWQASMGVKILDVDYVEEGVKLQVNGLELTGPLLNITKSTLKEGSFVPLGADENTRSVVLSDAGDAGSINVRRKVMADAEDPVAKERARVKTINDHFKTKGSEGAQFALEHIELGSDLLTAKAAWADKLEVELATVKAAQGTQAPPVPSRVPGKKVPSDDPIALFQGKVKELQLAGKKPGDAVRQLSIEEPELHQAYLEAYNAQAKSLRKGR